MQIYSKTEYIATENIHFIWGYTLQYGEEKSAFTMF